MRAVTCRHKVSPRRTGSGLVAPLILFLLAAQPASAIPPPSPDNTLYQATSAISVEDAMLGQWFNEQSYIGVDGAPAWRRREIDIRKVGYILTITVLEAGKTIQFDTLSYSPIRKTFDIMLNGLIYDRPNPAVNVVEARIADQSISWVRSLGPDQVYVRGRDIKIALLLRDGSLTEVDDTPSWPAGQSLHQEYRYVKHDVAGN